MSNQTELHRMRIDQGGTTAGYVIRLEILMNVTTPFRRKLTTHSGRN